MRGNKHIGTGISVLFAGLAFSFWIVGNKPGVSIASLAGVAAAISTVSGSKETF